MTAFAAAIRHLSVADAIALYLASAPHPLRAGLICRYMAVMHSSDETIVRQMLSRLVQTGRIARLRWGVYWWV